MHVETRITVHMGINFVLSPMPVIDEVHKIKFEQCLLESGIDSPGRALTEINDHEINRNREGASPLNIKVAIIAPPSVGQLVVIAPRPAGNLVMFAKEVDAIIKATDMTWSGPKQVIQIDATIRELFLSSMNQAFQELWERRLGQTEQALGILGRPVLGGGLRLVMPPLPAEPEPTQIEIKIESFLANSQQFFVETQFTWPQPLMAIADAKPENRLNRMNQYIEECVIPFVLGG